MIKCVQDMSPRGKNGAFSQFYDKTMSGPEPGHMQQNCGVLVQNRSYRRAHRSVMNFSFLLMDIKSSRRDSVTFWFSSLDLWSRHTWHQSYVLQVWCFIWVRCEGCGFRSQSEVSLLTHLSCVLGFWRTRGCRWSWFLKTFKYSKHTLDTDVFSLDQQSEFYLRVVPPFRIKSDKMQKICG